MPYHLDMSAQSEFDNYFAQLITDGCNQSEAWLRTARNLLSSAEAMMTVINGGRSLLWVRDRSDAEQELVSRSVQMSSQALMVYAFAIECLLKAYYLNSGNDLYVDGQLKKIPDVKASHDLIQVCDAVGLSTLFDNEQSNVLDKLTLWTEIGRYPAPLKSTRFGHKILANGDMKTKGIWSFSEEAIIFQILKLLYEKLGCEMPSYANILLEAQENVDSWLQSPDNFRK